LGAEFWRFEKNCFPLFYYENLQHLGRRDDRYGHKETGGRSESLHVYGFEKGKVVKITSAGVDVLVGKSIICFDDNGTELEVERCKRHDRFLQSSQSQSLALPAFHPWYLDYMPFEDRTKNIGGA
jgi:hypothetical protein